jgi:hypothetical protein
MPQASAADIAKPSASLDWQGQSALAPSGLAPEIVRQGPQNVSVKVSEEDQLRTL